jgi:hypothetical protein
MNDPGVRLVLVLALLSACGGEELDDPVDGGVHTADADLPDAGGTNEEGSASMSIGPGGATFSFEELTLEVPEGALEETVGVTITRTTRAAPEGYEAYSPVFDLEPSGTVFLVPVRITIRLPERAEDPTIYWATREPGGFYDTVASVAPGVVSAEVVHFSPGFSGRAQGPACSGGGSPCRVRNGSGFCSSGVCLLLTCDQGFGTLFKNCDGENANGCEVDVLGDTAGTQHCGDCYRSCGPFTNAASRCERGTCRITCESGFASCDGDDSDGCETRLSSPRDCGACGNDCARAPGSFGITNSFSCVDDPVTYGYHCVCLGLYGECDHEPRNGCETRLNSLMNCGACGRACGEAPANARPACKPNPAASSEACVNGWAPCEICGFDCLEGSFDCDGDAANGCESENPCPPDAGVGDAGPQDARCLGIKEGTCPLGPDAAEDAGVSPDAFEPDAAASPLLASSVADFSSTQGAGGWSYGYYPGNIDPAGFTLLPRFITNAANGQWVHMNYNPPWTTVWATGGHPNAPYAGGSYEHSVRRWTSNYSGGVRITGNLADDHGACGNGIIGYIIVNSATIYTQTIANGDTTGNNFDLTTNVQVGSTIDFVINANGNDDPCDSTRFTAVIERR